MTGADVHAVPIRVTGLRSAFGDHVIHDDLNLEVRKGEILGLVGGSGTGKSVLLNTILGLKRPDGGRVEFFGRDVDDPEANAQIIGAPGHPLPGRRAVFGADRGSECRGSDS